MILTTTENEMKKPMIEKTMKDLAPDDFPEAQALASEIRGLMETFVIGVAYSDYTSAETYMQVTIDLSGLSDDSDDLEGYPDVEDGWREQYGDDMATIVGSATDEQVFELYQQAQFNLCNYDIYDLSFGETV